MDCEINKYLNVMTLNCEGVNRNSHYISDVIRNNNCDIMCLQETWLIEQNMSNIGNINNDYLYIGKSGVDSMS